ncbi:MAG: TonB-dependent receptor, partial [Crocinitomicaceae bacterium]|nr:TonB-dependent receptor [Crocinitomicaceae bacterium]
MLKKLLFFVITLVGFTTFAQDFSIRGFVYDDSNMEPVGEMKVKLLKLDSTVISGAFTDNNGGFLIPKLAKGSYILKIEAGRFNKAFVNVNMTDKTKIYDVQFKLVRNTQNVKEVVVSIDSKEKKNEVLIGTLKYNQKSLDRIPSHGGENDIVGAISVTPGVVTTGDQGGQLYVRGGTPIQNKVLLDGMTIYNPFHSIGFFSIFETELVKTVDVYTGGFESKYGGRVSSVMDITYRDGNRREFAGRVSASPFLAKMVLEGPIGKVTKEKAAPGSYVFSAKHSLLDYTSKSLYPKVNDGNGLPFNFTDLYGKVTFNGDGGTKVSAFGFHNQDSVNYDIANLRWDASGGGVNFLMVPSGSPLFIRGHVNGSNYQTTFAETAQEPRYSKIGGFDLGFDFSYFLKNESEINYGFNINGFNTEFVTYNEAKRKIEATNFTTEIGSYFNYRLIKKRWVIQTGMRVQVYASLNTISP